MAKAASAKDLQVEKYSGIVLSRSIPSRQILEDITSTNTYIPVESLDLQSQAPENYFTVGVVVEF